MNLENLVAKMKTCKTCCKELPVGLFSPAYSGKYGVRAHCKDCAKQIDAKYQKKYKEKLKEEAKLLPAAPLPEKKPKTEKFCPRCKDIKPILDFTKNKSKFDGLASYCKLCTIEMRKEDKEKISEYLNRPDIREKRRLRKEVERRKKGVLQKRDFMKKISLLNAKHNSHVNLWKKNQAQKLRLAKKFAAHKHNAHVKAWYKENKKSILLSRSDVCSNLYFSVKGRIRRTLKHVIPQFSWRKMFPYSLEQLAQHIESQFADGMGWHNRTDWHIDHIRPISSFNILSHEDDSFAECFALSNLQPLWASANIAKGAKT